MITFFSVVVFLILATIALLFLRLFLSLLKSFFRAIFGNSFAQIKPREMLISIGITALIFTQTVNDFIRFFLQLLLEGYYLVSGSISKIMEVSARATSGYQDEMDNIMLAKELSSLLDNGLGRLAQIVNSFINNVSFADFLAAMACALIIATILNDNIASPLQSINHWFQSLTDRAKKRILLGTILIFGGYLSLASIIAIPWIQGMNNKDTREVTELRNKLALIVKVDKKAETENFSSINFEIKQLTAIRQKVEAFESEHFKPEAINTEATPLTEDTSSDKESTVTSTGNTPIQNKDTAKIANELDKAKRKIAFIEDDQKLLQKLWKEYQERIIEKKEELARQALGRFDTYVDTDLTRREVEIYQDQLRLWHSNALRILDRHVRNNKRRINDILGNWEHWVKLSFEDLERASKSPDKLYIYYNDHGSMFDLIEYPNDQTTNPPPTPKESLGLGVYGFFANWLVESRSFALALISGMIGFGLFGAVMARALITYEPDIEARVERESLDVLLVGFSAAVIIFLASQGGLALIANGEMQPNAYILFLSCFVGAAYGDKVWNTAKVRLKKSLEAKGSN